MAMSLDSFYSQHGLSQGVLNEKAGSGYFDEYVAFDSFEGFPEGTSAPEHPLYRPGYVATEETKFLELLERYGQSTRRVRTVRGFYSNSLTPELAQSFRERNMQASLVTIDCNLYESYRDVLGWCDEFLQPGSIIYLDDFNTFRAQQNRGPRLAWTEHCSRSRWKFERFLDVGWWGRSFLVQTPE
jgi:hypothetical protein